MVSTRAVVGLGALASVFAARVSFADSSAACQPACGSGQVCVDGTCAPASGGGPSPGEATPKVAAAPVRASASTPLWREGFLVIPSIGINSFQGDSGAGTGIGLRAGVLVGSRLAENWSLNVGAAFDLANLDVPAGTSASAYFLDIGFDPLFHFPLPKLEVLVGPVLGTWAEYGHSSSLGVPNVIGASQDTWAYGWTVGANAGVLFPVGTHAEIGGLVSFLLREPLKVCLSRSGGTDMCRSDGLDSAKTLALALAAMF